MVMNPPVAYDTNGNYLHGHHDDVSSNAEPEEHTTTQSVFEDNIVSGGNFTDQSKTNEESTLGDKLSDGNEAAKNVTADITQPSGTRREKHKVWMPNPSVSSDTRQGSDLCEVIGGKEGERVKLADALREPQQYWVDPETHEIWNKEFRKMLMEDEDQKAA